MNKRFSEKQVVGVLREAEAGLPVRGFADGMISAKLRIACGAAIRRDERAGRQALERADDGERPAKKLLAEQVLEDQVIRGVLREEW